MWNANHPSVYRLLSTKQTWCARNLFDSRVRVTMDGGWWTGATRYPPPTHTVWWLMNEEWVGDKTNFSVLWMGSAIYIGRNRQPLCQLIAKMFVVNFLSHAVDTHYTSKLLLATGGKAREYFLIYVWGLRGYSGFIIMAGFRKLNQRSRSRYTKPFMQYNVSSTGSSYNLTNPIVSYFIMIENGEKTGHRKQDQATFELLHANIKWNEPNAHHGTTL